MASLSHQYSTASCQLSFFDTAPRGLGTTSLHGWSPASVIISPFIARLFHRAARTRGRDSAPRLRDVHYQPTYRGGFAHQLHLPLPNGRSQRTGAFP